MTQDTRVQPLKALWIIYDPECGLCLAVKDWITRQPSLVALRMVAAGSEEAQRSFSQLPPGELAVVGDTGEVWLGNHAWIVCLWALRDYRDWAIRLSSPLLLPLARQGFAALSTNRGSISKLLGKQSERDLQRDLERVMVPKCESGRV